MSSRASGHHGNIRGMGNISKPPELPKGMFAARLNSVRAYVGLLLRYATLVGPAVNIKPGYPCSREQSIVGVLNVGGSSFSSLCYPRGYVRLPVPLLPLPLCSFSYPFSLFTSTALEG